MPAVTSILAATAAVGGAASLYGAYQQSEALKTQADFERSQANTNAAIADFQADDAIKRGGAEANRALREGRRVLGEQRVALAAQGIDINSGSAGDIQSETEALSQQDYETIKNNAWREAWGFKTQATNFRGSGKMNYIAGQNAAKNTLLMGGINAATQFGQSASYLAKGAANKKAAANASAQFDVQSSDEFTAPEFGSSLKRKPKYLQY